MAIVLTDDQYVTLDESSGLQNSGTPGANEDNNDSDIVYTDLPAAFSTRLFDAGQLSLSNAFAQANGAAQNDFISLTDGSTLTGFVMSNGDPLLAYDAGVPTDPTTGVLADFTTVDGEAIYLFADVASGLGAFMFLGVDENGDIVLAGYLESDGTISTVQFEAITNPDSGNHDDPVDLSGLLDVAGSGTIDFDFDDLPSSNNLFATLGPSPDGPAIVIFGADIHLKGTGAPTNTSDMMFMSQAGPHATIGMNNQMFNPGDAAFFAYVNDVNADFLSGWEPNGLTGTEADDADNALYTGGTLDVKSAKFTIAQIQGNSTGSMKLTTYLGAADTARDLLTGPTDGATSPNIIMVNVTIAGVTTSFDSDSDPAVSGFDVSGLGTATVTLTGVDDGYAIEFITDTDHNRVKIEGTAGKFDIGGFTITEGTSSHMPVGDRIVFEDDGPTVGDGQGTPALTVDDSDFTADDSLSYANLFDVDFGTDGGKDSDNDGTVDDDAVTYALGISGDGDDSGLVDSLTGDAVLLHADNGDVVGTTATDGFEVFRISVDLNTGEVTLDQSRAVAHDDAADPEEDGAGEPSKLASADLITLTATATDDDGDTGDHTVGIGDTFSFEDDGPAIGDISSDTVDFSIGSSVSNVLGAVPGNDGASVKITDFTPSFDFGFTTVVGVQEDDQTIVYYENTNGNGTIGDAGDTAYFQLALDDSDTDPANWNYVFDVLHDPNVVNIDFDFDNLPSGANLFGVVGESATDPAIIVFGKTPVFNSAGNYTNKSDVIHTSQGGTGATIGVNNQMFDAKEAAYFVYVDDPVANYLSGAPGGLTSTEADDADNVQYTGGTVDVHTASITVSQTQAGPKVLAGMKITTWLGDPDQGRDLLNDPTSGGPSPDIILVRVFVPGQANPIVFDADADPAVMGIDVSGLGTATATVTGLKNGYTVEWTTDDFHNRALIEATAGKFDVGKFAIAESTTVPDAELNFEVTIEDFDTNGDTAVDNFTVGIDGDHDGNVIV